MSKAQIVQLLITLGGILLALLAMMAGPFGIWGNAALSILIFFASGAVAGYAYAKLSSRADKAADLRNRVDNPPA
jgi:hypothetical protein